MKNIPDFNIAFMKEALKEAEKAQKAGEIPVGAVIVKNNKIIAKGCNKREKEQSSISHAEINAIKKANKVLKNFRLTNCDIYVTLEPCPMCAGAIIESRIKNIYFGAYEPKEGAVESVIDLPSVYNKKSFKTQGFGGIMEKECKALMQSFFKSK